MTQEKRSLKDVVKCHKYKLLVGASCIVTGVTVCLLLKEKNNMRDTVNTIQEAMSEGMIQEAIATTTRKLNTRLDIIDRLESKNFLRVEEEVKITKAIEEAELFKRRLSAFNKLESKYHVE